MTLRWIDLAAADVADHPQALQAIAERRLDGLTISGLFTPAECARAVRALEPFHEERVPAIFGTMLGVPLADLDRLTDDPHDRVPYLDLAEVTVLRLSEAFGFDPFDRLRRVLAPMAGGKEVTVPREHGRPYPAANVRWMEPGGGGLPAHVGNEFELQTEAAAEHLRSVSCIRDHYSWFVILQPPAEGGALSVFDRTVEDPVPGRSEWGPDGREDADFDSIAAKRVAPGAGTLVLFGGGWRWHRVDAIGGTVPRVTYGGFASPSTDGREFHLWF